jgi:phenylacetate-CoA ligase
MNPVESILKYASLYSPFYRNLGLQEYKLTGFPIMSRYILQSQMEHLLTLSEEEKPSLMHALKGFSVPSDQLRKSEVPYSANIVIEQTSGSSGIPLRVAKTIGERSQLSLAAWIRRKRYDPEFSVERFVPLFHRNLDTPIPVSPFESSARDICSFYNWLSEHNIRWLHAPPSLIAYHSRVLRSLGKCTPAPSLKFIELSGASPEQADIDMMKAVFGTRIINQYGTRESWTIGYSEELGTFDLNDDSVHVELLDDEERGIERINVEGAVAVTSKVLRLMPLIRYKTGDRGCWQLPESALRSDNRPFLKLSPDREINMLRFNGRQISGNILFKEILHKIDHKIGYGYAQYMQIRKVEPLRWKLMLYNCIKPNIISSELELFLKNLDPRNTLDVEMLPLQDSKELAERKPYLFVNECDSRITPP